MNRMNTLLRKLRGMLGVGLTWAVGWAIIMFILATIISVVDPDSIDAGEEPWKISLLVSTVGFVSGSAFALILSSAERRKSIRDLSAGRAALWGALGSAALPLLTSTNTALVYTAPLGALFAASTVAIARRAALREAEMVASLPPDPDAPRLAS